MPRNFLLLLSALLLPALAACSAGNGELSGEEAQRQFEAEMAAAGIHPVTEPCRVLLKDHRTNTTIGLLNEAQVTKSELYSKPLGSSDPLYKVIPNLDMGALMLALEEEEFFQEARPSSARTPGARMTILVERGSQSHSLAYTTQSSPEAIEQVNRCSIAVRGMYDKHMAYQRVNNDGGAAFFIHENDRARQEEQDGRSLR
ncbi:MAG: hypothetical protein DWQ01_16185 [Planctomycetota bacterium]|nr:MAG: hypothetical protein DWQ01_16185 [Planctomycetota bacterium]